MARLIYPGGILELLTSAEQSLPDDVSVQKTGPGEYLVIDRQKVYNLVISFQSSENKWRVRINGKDALIELQDDATVLLEKLGMTETGKHQALELNAPMPGMILDVLIQPGKKVEPGEVVLILEAMKMENLLKSSLSGTVSRIWVQKGDKVEKNQLLVSFE
jgi:biotin carboxyl carrier protein